MNLSASAELGKIVPSSENVTAQIYALAAEHPFLGVAEYGRSVLGAPLLCVSAGTGERRMLCSAAHHANEWMTASVLLKFLTELCEKFQSSGDIFGRPARKMLSETCLCFAPLVNPDGVDLVVGSLRRGTHYERACGIAEKFPQFPFPEGWKANIEGVDLNLQYPATWETARSIKYKLGFDRPAPRDYVGASPLSEPESLALASLTAKLSPDLVLAFHSQGEVIYWKYADYEPEGSRALAERLAKAAGYSFEETPGESGNAGYKDWFIKQFNRPGYTVELGLGENPLPVSEFDGVYAAGGGIIVAASSP